jgi:hypothetical protein
LIPIGAAVVSMIWVVAEVWVKTSFILAVNSISMDVWSGSWAVSGWSVALMVVDEGDGGRHG